ncbi:NAD(+)/NADH kinase [Candidatus Bathyarchaeota archaeon]|nr:NAD(+)/NADH kinase [Candidatus Bathyarchaeota archaeon]
MRKILTAGIISRLDKEQAVKKAEEMGKFLEERGIKVLYDESLAPLLGKKGDRLEDKDMDLAVILGGDGTILRAIHILKRGIPILAVNFGTVGFLADVSPQNALYALQNVLNGRFMKEDCFMLSNSVGLPDALNEIRIGTVIPSQMVRLGVSIDATPVAFDRADAILIATTTGASGYTMSAGGSVVDPRLGAIVIVPVCPLSSNFKSYVIPWDSEVSVKVSGPSEFVVIVDGQFSKRLKAPEDIIIRRSKDKVTFFRVEQSFYERLKRRLSVSSLGFME